MFGVSVFAVNPEWWWSTVFLPAAGGIGWLSKHFFDLKQFERVSKQADRTEVREERSDEWNHIKETNTILSNQVQGLEAKVAQFDPTLAQIQKEYRETLTREMDGLEQLRDCRMKLADLESKYADAMRDVHRLEKDTVPDETEGDRFTGPQPLSDIPDGA